VAVSGTSVTEDMTIMEEAFELLAEAQRMETALELSFEFALAKMDDLARSGHFLEALAHGREYGVKMRMDSVVMRLALKNLRSIKLPWFVKLFEPWKGTVLKQLVDTFSSITTALFLMNARLNYHLIQLKHQHSEAS
jgi:hypothetical protein